MPNHLLYAKKAETARSEAKPYRKADGGGLYLYAWRRPAGSGVVIDFQYLAATMVATETAPLATTVVSQLVCAGTGAAAAIARANTSGSSRGTNSGPGRIAAQRNRLRLDVGVAHVAAARDASKGGPIRESRERQARMLAATLAKTRVAAAVM